MDGEIANGLLTLIQDGAAFVLNHKDTSSFVKIVVDDTLINQLRDSEKSAPDGLILDLSGLLDRLNVFDVVGDGNPQSIGNELRSRIGKLGGPQEFAKSLLAGNGIEAVRRLIEGLKSGAGPAGDAVPANVEAILRRQVGIAISFATTLKNLANLDLVRRIPEGWKQYFFEESGFKTVDGIPIVAPGHGDLLSTLVPPALTGEGLKQSLTGLRGLLTERSAEQYVRDMIRILVEVAGDVRYGLRDRHAGLLRGARDSEKAARWFKGAGSMAESLVTSAVEEACLGVSQFQTNPVIAAAAATYAGTAARKATQHVFLSEVGV